MAESHLQVNYDGSTVERKTVLWPSSKKEQEEVITSFFQQNNWKVKTIQNQSGSFWKLLVVSSIQEYKINLFISSIRDESRQSDEFKMQLGSQYPEKEENGWLNLILGVYTISDGSNPNEYILAGYSGDGYNFASNPSLRGTRTKGLQIAKFKGFYISEGCVIFRPEFIYYYIDYLRNSENKVISKNLSTSGTLVDISPDIINALKTKPFLLIAGISGTGKSRKVQELAYLTCKRDGNLDQDETSPGNYLLIPVKPNWHDSTELLGYYSSISGKYILTDFIRFVWKAWQHRDTSFFICLDEMNLAPVEQYFAEYLSVIETRKRVKDEVTGEYYIQTAELLPKKTFESLDVKEHVVSAKPEGGYVIDDSIKITNAYKGDDYQIMLFLKENGLRIPDNLFVIGTVNMDDTTHQFSRKVIDRAFTIEMNGGNLKDMFVEHDTLSYQQEPLALDAVKPRFVKAADVLEFYKEDAEIIKEEVPKLLEYINGENIFKDTPFRVSYRVQNELIIYYAAIRPEGTLQEEEVKNYLKQAFMSILLEKVLPRVEGDEKTMRCDEKNDSTILLNLKSYLENNFKPKEPSGEITSEGDAEENDEKKDSKLTYNKANVYSLLIDKLDEMNKRVKSSYFTSFFS